jgi:acetyl esterase/lipase
MSGAATGGRVLLVLAPGTPVDRGAVAGFCARWSEELPARFELASIDQIGETDDLRGVVVDFGDGDPSAALERTATAGVPAALVSTRAATDAPGALDSDGVFRIAGRGVGGYRWGALHVLRRSAWPATQIRYGPHPEQVADLRLPEGRPPHPVVVLIHGGGWKDLWRRDIMEGLAVDLAQRGLASWNLDFRRVGPSGGGWPATFDDVDAGVEALRHHRDLLDLERLVLVGHSSGGQLALTQAARCRRNGMSGLRLAVSISGVVDLVEGARRGLVGGETIVHRLLGGSPEEVPERYREISPLGLVPLGVPQLLVQGLLDYIPDLVDLNRLYFAAAVRAGDEVELVELEDVDHLGPIEPEQPAWEVVCERMERALASGAAAGGVN